MIIYSNEIAGGSNSCRRLEIHSKLVSVLKSGKLGPTLAISGGGNLPKPWSPFRDPPPFLSLVTMGWVVRTEVYQLRSLNGRIMDAFCRGPAHNGMLREHLMLPPGMLSPS